MSHARVWALQMTPAALTLSVLRGTYAICRLLPGAPIPRWATKGKFYALTRTADELSIVCRQSAVPPAAVCDRDWRCLKVEGPLDLASTGILAALATPLARAGISLFALSTYDTDYLLVKKQDLEKTIRVLTQAGIGIGQPTFD